MASSEFDLTLFAEEQAWDQEDDAFVLVDLAHAIKVAHAILYVVSASKSNFGVCSILLLVAPFSFRSIDLCKAAGAAHAAIR